MKVLHIIPRISRRLGGPSRSVQGLVAAQCAAGIDAWLRPLEPSEEPWISGVRYLDQPITEETLRQFDVVHIHEIWNLKLHRVAAMCRKAGVKYVSAPRGMLEPWALKQKWLKKRIARFLYQDRDLRFSAALHATAESEAEQFRALGFKNRIIVSPNGVNVPEGDLETQVASRHANLAKSDVATTPTTSATPQSTFCQGSSRRALFVSRMHPKKGVLELVESWGRVKPKDWQCELVYTMNGDEERAYEQKVKCRIRELGLDDQFVLTGSLDDGAKWDAYVRADLFVLPSYSENFGIVVAEALWAGVPVITTKGTPWSELEDRRCGWWIDIGMDPLVKVLKEAMALSDEERRTMGMRGRELVREKYSWSAVAKQMKDVYQRCGGESGRD